MNDDLISRKEAVELVIAEYDRFQANGGSHSGRHELDKVIKMLQNMPTAFDKEKVINELREELNLSDAEKERCARENPLQFDSAKGYANGIANAIEIVEKGGIE